VTSRGVRSHLQMRKGRILEEVLGNHVKGGLPIEGKRGRWLQRCAAICGKELSDGANRKHLYHLSKKGEEKASKGGWAEKMPQKKPPSLNEE